MPVLHHPAPGRRTAPPLAVLAILSLVVGLLATATSASASPSEESAFVAGVNQARAAVGLPALTVDSELISLARGWTNQMKDGVCGEDKHICHANPISAGLSQDWAKLGENVGTGPDVNSVMDAFIASPGHYANIVDPEFTHIGVGVIRDPDNPARLYTTHRFMKLQNAPEPEPEPEPTSEPEPEAASESESEPAPEPAADEPAAPAPTADEPADTAAPAALASTEPSQDPASNGDPADEEPARPTAPPPVTLERAEVVVRALSRLD